MIDRQEQRPEPANTTTAMSPPDMATLVLLMSLSALSISIFLPSLPSMANFFEVDYAIIQLAVSGYLILNAPVQLVSGPLSDHYGRRRMVLIACGIFILATIGCLLTTNVYLFLFFRMVQAVIVCAAVITRAVVRDLADEAKAASMLGYITMAMAVVPMVGPLLGGFLDELFGWQATFILLLVTTLGITALAYFDMGETAPMTDSKLRDQIAQYPKLLKSNRFWGFCAITTFANAAFFLFLTGGPLLGAIVFDLSPSEYGLYFAMMPLGFVVGNFLSGWLSESLGLYRMIVLGIAVAVFGLTIALLLELAGLSLPIVFFGLLAFVGIGNGMVLPNATSGLLSVDPASVGSASGLGAAIMTVGGALVSTLVNIVVFEGSGSAPLMLLMVGTFALSAVALLYVRGEHEEA